MTSLYNNIYNYYIWKQIFNPHNLTSDKKKKYWWLPEKNIKNHKRSKSMNIKCQEKHPNTLTIYMALSIKNIRSQNISFISFWIVLKKETKGLASKSLSLNFWE